jgi:hypothetical protein
MLTAKRKCTTNYIVPQECCKPRVNTGDVRIRELVLADTLPKLRKETQRKFFLSILLSFLVLTCFYVLAVEVISLHLITDTHTHGRIPLDEGIGSSQRPLPDNTQHSQEKDIYALVRIRTRNPSTQTAADPGDTARPPGSACFLLSMLSTFDPNVWHLTVWHHIPVCVASHCVWHHIPVCDTSLYGTTSQCVAPHCVF